MKSSQTGGRQTPWTLSIAALLLVALSGCLGASGLGVTGTDAVNQATPTGETTGATEAPGTTAHEPGSTTDDTPDGSTAGAATTSSGTATEESSSSTPGNEAGATTESSDAGSSAGASSSASSSSSDGSDGSDGASSSESTTEAATTEAVADTPTAGADTPTAGPATTQATTATTTEGATAAGSSPTPSVSTPPPTTETPLPPQGLVSDCAEPVVDDHPAKVLDCQLEDYPQPKADVQVVVANAGDEPVDRVRVTLLLFDREGNEAERDVRFVNDLPAGESFGYIYETETDFGDLSKQYVVVVQVVE